MLQISGIYVYPIKSLPGISLNEAKVTNKGFEYDRRWMLVDENNQFLSQREYPEMTQFIVSIESEGLLIRHKLKGSSLVISFETPVSDNPVTVTVWDDTCTGEFVSAEADLWFSVMLGINCRLLYMPDDYKRIVDQRYAPEDAVTSFSDGYPFLLIGQASLDDLNSRLTEKLPMDRFRPNVVFTGGNAYWEDLMGNFTINGINFYGVKLCARCVMTTVNQESGAKGKEPLKTLASYRLKNKKIMFGQNLVHNGEGTITVGDEIQIISLNHEQRFIMTEKLGDRVKS